MINNVMHPGLILLDMITEKGISQRELSNKINIAQPLLNSILNGKRNISIDIAIALEAAGYKKAIYWLNLQAQYMISKAREDNHVAKNEEAIKTWNELEEFVPLSYFKNIKELDINGPDDYSKIFDIYKVSSVEQLKSKVQNFKYARFRKSTSQAEEKKHIAAWSYLSNYLAQNEKAKNFDVSRKDDLLSELRMCFYNNKDIINKTKKILYKYGIKLVEVPRPTKTPVDGQSFYIDENPVIALSYRFRRVDNFAFNIFHELAHVFDHLSKDDYKNEHFIFNSTDMEKEEMEANLFARNNLISKDLWLDFISKHFVFTDDVIEEFAEENKIHPGIVRGRVCHENPIYYKKRSRITQKNKLEID